MLKEREVVAFFIGVISDEDELNDNLKTELLLTLAKKIGVSEDEAMKMLQEMDKTLEYVYKVISK